MTLRRKITRQEQVRFLPHWLRERTEVDSQPIVRLIKHAAREISPGARVLDAGAGEGQYRSYFRHTRYVGLDLAIGDATWNYRGLSTLGDLSRMPFADNSFDAVICTQTLEHVRDPQRVLQEIGRCLRPGGELYLSVPQRWHQHQKPYDFYRYTSFGLRHLIEQGGMEVERMEPMGGYFTSLAYQIQLFPYWLLQHPETPLRRLLLYPVKIVLWLIFFLAIPLFLIWLDRVDRLKDETIGWTCQARRFAPKYPA